MNAEEVPAEVEALAFVELQDHVKMVVGFFQGQEAAGLSHGELEGRLEVDAREFARLTLQGHLRLRAQREARLATVVDAAEVARSHAEGGHSRGLATLFGAVEVSRIAYRSPGAENLHPADAALNLPAEKHSHGLRRLAAIEASRGSFEEAGEAIERATGQGVAKRQVSELAQRCAADFDAFYAERKGVQGDDGDLLVVSRVTARGWSCATRRCGRQRPDRRPRPRPS